MLDYEILKILWWLFLGVILSVFSIMDGQDMGIGAMLPFVGKTDDDKRVMINAVAPHWDGNQVWLILGGGAIFAAWPMIYATAFSGFYWAMLLVLFALFFRPVGFDYRGKVEHTAWKTTWDWLLFIGSVVPPIVCGVAFGNLLQGVPFYFDNDLRSWYTGSFWALLNPFALVCGVAAISLYIQQGANYLYARTTGSIQAAGKKWSVIAGYVFSAMFVLGGLWCYFGIDGYVITSPVDPAMLPNPLNKTVTREAGAWFINYGKYPVLWLIPLIAVGGSLLSVYMIKLGKAAWAIICSSLAMIGTIFTPLISMFPFLLPSSTNFVSSLTAWDCTSSQLTLFVMLIVTLIFLPIVLLYTAWAYYVLRGKLTPDYIKENSNSLY
ncbi:MAG: cytochrome d ubiquinol oxidase subunit II [Burkholderiales bacterium]|nr:cytochrome d ubiquinol oxidase subunit II [Burkholderiales bacterium]